MLMKGHMEKDIPQGTVMHQAEIEWRVNAVVSDDSKKFAAELEEILNKNTKEGFIVSSFLSRTPDNALVVIQQRTIIHIPGSVPHTPVPEKEAN
jgi:hypothetical protein